MWQVLLSYLKPFTDAPRCYRTIAGQKQLKLDEWVQNIFKEKQTLIAVHLLRTLFTTNTVTILKKVNTSSHLSRSSINRPTSTKALSEVANKGDKSKVLDHIFMICTETLQDSDDKKKTLRPSMWGCFFLDKGLWWLLLWLFLPTPVAIWRRWSCVAATVQCWKSGNFSS